MNRMVRFSAGVFAVLAVVFALWRLQPALRADGAPQVLPFSQDWANVGLITTNNDWSSVPGIIGYRGDALTSATGVNPQTIVADGTTTPVNVITNQISPGAVPAGGVAEFEI